MAQENEWQKKADLPDSIGVGKRTRTTGSDSGNASKKHLDVVHVSLSPDDESLDSNGAGPSISCTGWVNVRHRLGYAE